MAVLYIVLPLAILIAVAAVTAFVWMVRSGQLDDLETPAMRILYDDTEVRRSTSRSGARDPGEAS
ncbi:MAG: cbb3-type cytochrome oxidase assembly protein CcoS [Myxococcota bacterium]